MAGSTGLMTLRYPGQCVACGATVPATTTAYYDRSTKTVTCRPCAEPATPDPPDPVADLPRQRIAPGTAGGSAQRQYDRRAAKREARIRAEHPILGRLILALSDEPQSTRAWAAGARGEQVVAHWLDQLTPRGVLVLHDRRIPRTRANIDHLASRRPPACQKLPPPDGGRARTPGGGPRAPTRRRRRDRDGDGMPWQVQKVREVLAAHGGEGVPVTGMLCFVDAEWPPGSGPLVIDDIHVLWPKKIRDHLRRARALDQAGIDHWHRVLAGAFRSA
ncbi:MAG: NERD domain-containing protein [Kineosporiaceae bacterium]|nr:NERD domain-containing protein [Kineosporiaceae bacterium]